MGSEGDVRPYIALARALRARGHEAALATSDNFTELVMAAGIEFHPMRQYYGDPPPLLNLRVFMAARSTIETKDGYLDELWNVCQGADAVVYNAATYPCFYIAEKLGIPSFGAFVQPHHSTGAFPHPIVTEGRPLLGSISNQAGFWLFNLLHWRYVRKSINQWREETLGLRPLGRSETLMRQLRSHRPNVLYAFSSSLVPRPRDWRSDRLTITGYWYMDAVTDYTPPPELDSFLRSGPPPVFISVLWNRDKFDEISIPELGRLLGQRLLVQDLHGQLDGLASTGDIFYYRGGIPHEWLFKRVALAVHHGGLGICMNCIRAGIPMIAIPAQGVNDHRFWAYRVSKMKLGVHLPVREKTKQFPKQLAAVIRKTLGSETIRSNVKRLSVKIGSENGLQNAVRAIIDAVKGQGQEADL